MHLSQLKIVYEDNHLIAVDKPAGALVQHDDEGEDIPLEETVKEYIKLRYDKPGDVFLGVIHRIDRPVSGLVMFARTSKSLERMNKMFQERSIQKTYLAIVENRPENLEDTITHFLIKDKERNIARASIGQRGEFREGKEATLSYRFIGGVGNLNLLEVRPATGRPHQIRVQLAKIGCPIWGDVKYGASKGLRDGSICLHAYSLDFEHPVKKEQVTITVPPPRTQLWGEFKGVLDGL